MFTIRRNQLQSIVDNRRREFRDSLAGYVRELDEGRTAQHIPEPELRARIDQAVARAEALGIEWASSIAGFVGLTFLFGPGFETIPDFARVLNDSALDPNLRVDALMDVPASAWAKAGLKEV